MPCPAKELGNRAVDVAGLFVAPVFRLAGLKVLADEFQVSNRNKGRRTMDLMSNNLWRVKVGLAEMLKGGVIMDVTTAAQAKIAEDAGACAVMALERVPADIR